MFTGIVETVGEVREAESSGALRKVSIHTKSAFLNGLGAGGSIAVDGACLTAVEVHEDEFRVELVETTLSRTVASTYRRGTRVNLERATRVGDRLDGHLVQGHVDGLGHVTAVREHEGFHLMEVSIPEEVHQLTIEHGSITLNGVSLTVNRLLPEGVMEVALIPHTWEATNLRYLTAGDPVNVEGDLIGKYVGKLLRHNDEELRGERTDAL